MKIINESIILVQFFDEHWYKVTENEKTFFIPSVTTKLGVKDKPFLAKWRGDIGNREADLRMHEAGQRGTRIHWAVEIMLKGGAVLYDAWQNPVFTSEGIKEHEKQYGEIAVLRTQDEMLQVWKVKQQLDILKPEVVGVEMTVFDTEQMDAGTIDGIYRVKAGSYMISGSKPLVLKEGLYIYDLKTGSTVTDDVWLQLAPYMAMYEKRTGSLVQGALVTHTSAKTKSGIAGLTTLYRSREDLVKNDYPDYRAASKLWMRDHANDQPRQYEFPSKITLKN